MPTVRAYDPAYAYELAVIVEDGIRRMYVDREHAFYYLTAMNETYLQPAMPRGRRGRHPARASTSSARRPIRRSARACTSSAAAPSCARCCARRTLLAAHGVAADVWSVTSYSELRRDALSCERWNRAAPGEPPIACRG